MGDYDRRVYRSSWKNVLQVEIDVLGSTEIDKGDLLFYDRVDGLRDKGTSTASNTVFPFSKLSGSTNTLASNRTLAAENFVGVAAWHSDSGVTELLAVHIDGLFRYPLKNARHTKVGYHVIPAGSGITLYDQKVAVTSSSSDYIGIACDSEDFASSVDVRISTLWRKLKLL
jgi:hypothetical protein